MGQSVEQLANQQILRWLAERKLSEERSSIGNGPPGSRIQPMQHPMVTVSRQYGAYGGEMGRILARVLGIDYHAQELVHQMAARSDVRKQVVEALDERTQTNIQLWIDQLINVRRFAASDYTRALSQTVLAVARHSPGVIIGRGAHLILDPKRTLRVRAFAPLEQRVEYVAEREGMTQVEARIKVSRVDQERDQFFRSRFNIDIQDPLGYDLMLNTGAISLESCAQIVAEAYRQRF
jgi:cytidylate kinase